MTRTPGPLVPSVAETLKHPAFPTAIWNLEPDRKGLVPVAKGRGGPINISWEIHGSGPVKLVLIMGLGALKSAWQRQTLHFGHEQHTRYSVLLIDNRGMGDSDKPLMRYSTSEMALDIAEVLAHPPPYIENTTTFAENMAQRASMLLPKQSTARGEMHKRLDRSRFGIKGFLLQLIAAGWHHKSRAQLEAMAEQVGRERILVMHGTQDRMISLPHGEKLIEFLRPGRAVVVRRWGTRRLWNGVSGLMGWWRR
ncbi:hypothetical protein N0V88_005528 [Collariella sp. IMI 366227]|nr:hypothetical protein N0V88_005528 [Collariella sp. IMI 366227]